MTPIAFIATVPLEDWRYAWRLDQLDQPMPDRDRERIKPLASISAKVISEQPGFTELHRDFPFKKGLFKRVDSLPLNPLDHQDAVLKEDEKVRKWLAEKGIPFDAMVFLGYDGSNIVLTDWEMLIRYWRLFYYPISDDLTVYDGALDWCLLFFHEHEIFFGTNQKELPKERS